MRALIFIALLCVVGAAVNTIRSTQQRKMPSFAYHRDENPMNVPLVLNVFLVGFDGTGGSGFSLTATKLEQFLFDLFPEHHPVCQDTGEKLHVAFEIWYNVIPVHTSYLEKAYTALKKDMVEIGETVVLTVKNEVTELPVYEVPVDGGVHEYFQSVFDEHTKTARYKTGGDPHRTYGLFIVNPDKSQFAPGGIRNKQFVYRYRTEGQGMSSAFVSRTRYAVLDISAGPSQMGQSSASEGTVTYFSFPNLPELAEKFTTQEALQNEFMAQISKPIISAIQHIFAPDIRFDALDYSEKILVPILVFRNHIRFNPLEEGHIYSLNKTAVTAALKLLALPHQEVEVIYGLHSIADHELISMAVERASKSNTVYHAKAGKFQVTTSHYVESTQLHRDLTLASDYLAAGILSSSHTLKKAFFPDEFDKTQGTRILPVMIFSLLDDGEPLLFDRTSLYSATKDMVLVLQNNVDDLQLPFFSEKWNVDISSLDPTPQTIAGLAEAMSGIVSPSARYSNIESRLVYDYTWSIGFHPFGPFSNGTNLSLLHQDLSLRNSIISRCDAALSKIQDALKMLDKFAEIYLRDPWGSDVKVTPPPSALVEYFYQHKESAGALGISAVNRLREDLSTMQGLFEQTAEVLYYLDLQKAHTMSDRVFRKASAFHKYVLTELESTETALFCCSIDHSVVKRTDYAQILRSLIGWLSAAAIVFLILGYTPANPSHLARRLNPKRFAK